MHGARGALDGSAQAGFGRDSAEPANHGGDDLGRGDAALQTVGVGKEIPLEAAGLGIEVGDEGSFRDGRGQKTLLGDIEEAGLDDKRRDVKPGGSLGNGYGQRVDVAASNPRVDFGDRRAVVEVMLAGFEGAALPETDSIEAVAAA